MQAKKRISAIWNRRNSTTNASASSSFESLDDSPEDPDDLDEGMKVTTNVGGRPSKDAQEVALLVDTLAGGSLRTSTRPTCSDEPSPRVCMSTHPEGNSCGHVQSRLECLF